MAREEYLWDVNRWVHHLQSKRWLAACGRFWLRGQNKHVYGTRVKLDSPPINLCAECKEVAGV